MWACYTAGHPISCWAYRYATIQTKIKGVNMAELLVFHSGNPSWVSCRKAIGVAEEMKRKYGDSLELRIYTTDSKEAEPYHFRSSTNVLFEKELVPVGIATDSKKMDAFLSSKLWKMHPETIKKELKRAGQPVAPAELFVGLGKHPFMLRLRLETF